VSNKPQLAIVDQVAIEIDHGVPLPPLLIPLPKLPWERLKVSDSFFVKGDRKLVTRVRSAAKERAKRSGEKYTCRAKANGIRVWRIK
jgi:hypothetical protein